MKTENNPGKVWVRWLSAVVCAAALTLALLCGSETLWLYQNGAYGPDRGEALLHNFSGAVLSHWADELSAEAQRVAGLVPDKELLRFLEEWTHDPNVTFMLRKSWDRGEKILFTNVKREPHGHRSTAEFSLWVEDDGQVGQEMRYTVEAFLPMELTPGEGVYRTCADMARRVGQRTTTAAVTAVSAGLGLLTLAVLLRKGGEVSRRLSRLPLEPVLALLVLDGAFLLNRLTMDGFSLAFSGRRLEYSPAAAAAGVVLLLILLVSLAETLHRRTARETLLFPKVWKKLAPAGKALAQALDGAAGKLPSPVTAALVLGIFTGADLLGIGLGLPVFILVKLAECAVLVWFFHCLRRLEAGGQRLAEGNLEAGIALDHLRGGLRAHAEVLNHLKTDIQKAVDRQMKSERMKTELITNVSHDIKTPLTSIVNYVDLLKKEPMATENAKTYLDVLDRQSARLKKLTEDLVEASKAATGNLTVDLVPTDVNVLLAQSAGEYEEQLAARDLRLVLRPAPEEPRIMADGRLLWRVFQNLFSNIAKYAQPGTRVYLASEVRENWAAIIFRNISAQELDISPEELMGRFVRGDAARTTEGSGLGLSIALSLTQLQQGSLEFAIDGDLVKVTLLFPLLPPEGEKQEEKEAGF